jgi:hypothetical protein
VVSVACGHRDANSASDDIKLNYVGPNFPDTSTARCFFENTSGDSRAIRWGALCTSASVGLVASAAERVPVESEPQDPEMKLLSVQEEKGIRFEMWGKPIPPKAKRLP